MRLDLVAAPMKRGLAVPSPIQPPRDRDTFIGDQQDIEIRGRSDLATGGRSRRRRLPPAIRRAAAPLARPAWQPPSPANAPGDASLRAQYSLSDMDAGPRSRAQCPVQAGVDAQDEATRRKGLPRYSII